MKTGKGIQRSTWFIQWEEQGESTTHHQTHGG